LDRRGFIGEFLATEQEQLPTDVETMNPAEIMQTGVQYASEWLRRSGYEVKPPADPAEPSEIHADHASAKILVHVKISVFPAQPKDLTAEEVAHLKARAALTGRRPYAAVIMIDAKGHLVRDAQWRDLPH
jgi:hypothetical protein